MSLPQCYCMSTWAARRNKLYRVLLAEGLGS